MNKISMKCMDAKEIEKPSTRFGVIEAIFQRKCRRLFFKQQFEPLTISSFIRVSERYDRFQQLLFLSWKLMVQKYQLRMQIISFSGLCPQHGPICCNDKDNYKPYVYTLSIDFVTITLGFLAGNTCTPSTSSTSIPEKEVLAGFADEQRFSKMKAYISTANEIYAKDEKPKRYRRIGMIAVKEKEQLQKILTNSWKDSSMNLWRLINFGMGSNSKVGLGGPQEPEPNVSDDRSSEYSTCLSNDSAGSIGTSSKHSVDPESEILSVPPKVYVSTPITTNEKGVSDPKSKKPVPTKTSNSFSPKRPQVNLFNQRRHFSKSHSSVRRPFAKITAQMSHSHAVKENWGSAVKTSAGSATEEHVDRGKFDVDASRGHRHVDKDQLEDFEEYKGDSVTFGRYFTNVPILMHLRKKDEDESLMFVPLSVKNTEEKLKSRKSSTNTQEKEI
ncbi:hypothetical protein Tco_0474135 [Tanacetum coccineum]